MANGKKKTTKGKEGGNLNNAIKNARAGKKKRWSILL